MKIKTTTTHTVTFSVQAFRQTEGGMDHLSFPDNGKDFGDIGGAIEMLSLAKSASPDEDWIIVCDVDSQVSSNEI